MAQPLRTAIDLSLQSVVDILAVAIPDDPAVPQPANQPAELDEIEVFIGTLRNEEDELRQLTQTLLTSTAAWSNVIAKLPNADRPAAEDAFANYQLNANYQDRLRNEGRRIRTLRQRIDAAELRARTLRRAIAAAAPPPAAPAVPVVAPGAPAAPAVNTTYRPPPISEFDGTTPFTEWWDLFNAS